MKCTVGKEALLTHLQKVCNIVSRRPVLPILNNVRLEAEPTGSADPQQRPA